MRGIDASSGSSVSRTSSSRLRTRVSALSRARPTRQPHNTDSATPNNRLKKRRPPKRRRRDHRTVHQPGIRDLRCLGDLRFLEPVLEHGVQRHVEVDLVLQPGELELLLGHARQTHIRLYQRLPQRLVAVVDAR